MGGTDDTTRRNFVKAAGAVTAAAAAFPEIVNQAAAAIPTARAAARQVRYGMVGTGAWGASLLRHMARLDNCQCAAVCDTDENNLKTGTSAARTQVQEYRDYRALLDRKDIEALVIATPLHTHFPITRDALMAGKHVFCENCLVFKAEEVHALRSLAAERPQQVLQTGLQRRYSAFYQGAKTMAAKGLLGNVTHIIAQWHRNPGWLVRQFPDRQRERNWMLYREYSGGLVAEFASHQIDVANWMFGSRPEFVMGVGGQEFTDDGRDVYDNVQLIYKYPRGQKLVCTAISTNQQLPLFGEHARAECGERIMGTGATVEITVGTEEEPAIALWYYEPRQARVTSAASYGDEQGIIGGATLGSTGHGRKGYPILLGKDEFHDDDSFFQKEAKYARRWLYSKGWELPQEDRSAIEAQMESFFDCCRSGSRSKAGLEVGLASSTAVILSNLALDTGRRVYFDEIDKMGRNQTLPERKS